MIHHSRTRRLAASLAAAFTLVPLALYAYLGQFSRLMGDDWGYFANVQWLGFRDAFYHWWNSWQGSYTFVVSIEALAALGPRHVAPIFPALVLLVWLVGLTWLVSLALRYFELAEDSLLLSFIFAAFLLVAAITAFPTRESIYWMSATIRQTLPVGIFALLVAFALEFGGRNWPKRMIAAAASLGAIASFLNGGLSEFWALLQIVYLSTLLVTIRVCASHQYKQRALATVLASWVGSFASIALQLNSPGIRARMLAQLSLESLDQHRPLPLLAGTVWNEVSHFVGQQGGLAGFALTMAVGLTAALVLSGSGSAHSPAENEERDLRIRNIAIISLSLTAMGIFASVAIGVYSAGVVFQRTMVSSALLQVLSGMLLGSYIGFLIQRAAASTPSGSRWRTGFILLGLSVAGGILLNIVSRQSKLIPDFQTYAQDWDARHHRIVQLRESGESDIEVAPLRFDLSKFISPDGRSFDSVSPYFYQVDSIIVAEDAKQ